MRDNKTMTKHLHEAIRCVIARNQTSEDTFTLRDHLYLIIGYLQKNDPETADLLERLLLETEHGTVHSNNSPGKPRD